MTTPVATILIVDNENRNRLLLEAMLKPAGYVTLIAATGEEAFALIAKHMPDLILLDIMMPGVDGYQVARTIKDNPATSSIPIIMVTAHVGRDIRLAGLKAGAEEFLTTPVDQSELLLRVRNLLRLKAYGDLLQNHSVILEQQVAARTESLRDSDLRFRQMADNIRDAFFLIGAEDGRILYMSPAYEAISGRSCESLRANPRSWTDAVHPDDRERVTKNCADSVVSGQFDQECRILHADGTGRWVRVRGYPIRDEAGGLRRIAGIAVDITARKEAEDEIRRLNETLEQRVTERTADLATLNEELQGFSNSVSHDLRAPLRHIMGFVELMKRNAAPPLSEENLQHLAKISRSATHMWTLIDDLLAFSRVGRAELRKSDVDLDRLVREAVGEFQAETKERNIEWAIHALPPVRADRALLRMVLVNLISNAVKFTGARADARIEIGCAPRRGGETVIFVRDNGAGFNPKYSEKLFGVFQRLHSQAEFEGTGIGLANVQRILTRHGGRAWAEGSVGEGATFYFAIQLAGHAAGGIPELRHVLENAEHGNQIIH